MKQYYQNIAVSWLQRSGYWIKQHQFLSALLFIRIRLLVQLSSDGKNRACWHSQRIQSCQGIKCDWMNEKSSEVTSCYFCWLNGLSLLFFSRIVLPISVEEVCAFDRCFFMVYIYKKFRFESGHNLKSLFWGSWMYFWQNSSSTLVFQSPPSFFCWAGQFRRWNDKLKQIVRGLWESGLVNCRPVYSRQGQTVINCNLRPSLSDFIKCTIFAPAY